MIVQDGPSAGMAFTVGLVSLFSERRVPPTLAMTGEMSLRGKVTAVGALSPLCLSLHGVCVDADQAQEVSRRS